MQKEELLQQMPETEKEKEREKALKIETKNGAVANQEQQQQQKIEDVVVGVNFTIFQLKNERPDIKAAH